MSCNQSKFNNDINYCESSRSVISIANRQIDALPHLLLPSERKSNTRYNNMEVEGACQPKFKASGRLQDDCVANYLADYQEFRKFCDQTRKIIQGIQYIA